jgi:hypothetical protein
MRWARQTASIEKVRNAYKILVGNPEGKRSLWRPWRNCEDDIKTALKTYSVKM